MTRRQRANQRLERPTLALAATALGTALGVAGLEVARVWRRGSAPLPAEAPHILEAAATATRETGEVARAGLRSATERESALLNLYGSLVLGFAGARLSTAMIRRRGRFGPFRDLRLGRRHVHHFVPGLLLALAAGAWSILSPDEGIDPALAIPFGLGLGLTLDESALLLELDDVYWTQEGVLSIQVGATTTALLGATVITRRVLRRGEAEVLEGPTPPPAP